MQYVYINQLKVKTHAISALRCRGFFELDGVVNGFSFLSSVPASVESVMERDRYMSPMEAQDFGLIDLVLVHPPHAGQDEPELVQKEPAAAAAASPSAQPESAAAEEASTGTNPPSSYKPEP